MARLATALLLIVLLALLGGCGWFHHCHGHNHNHADGHHCDPTHR